MAVGIEANEGHAEVHRGGRLDDGDVAPAPVGVNGPDGVSIGEGAIIGAAAVVREDVGPRAVAVGIPARVVSTI